MKSAKKRPGKNKGLPKNIIWRDDRKVYWARFNGKSKASPDLEAVKIWLANGKVKTLGEGRGAANFEHDQRIDALKALAILPSNWTLQQCAQFVADHLRRTTQVLSIDDVIKQFLKTKKKHSQYHTDDLSRRLSRWKATMDPTRPVHSVTRQEIETYLADFQAQNFVNTRAALSNLLGYAFKIGAAPENPVTGIDKPLITRARPAVLSAKQMSRLLARAAAQKRYDIVAWLVLGGLVGLRPYEALRTEWSGIQLETSEIRIEPSWTKVRRARVIPLQANALEWLHTLPTGTGRVLPPESTWNNRWRRWREEKKHPVPLSWWVQKDDVLRHSYGTYRAAILRNSPTLAEEMGTSVQMVRSHYDAVVSPSVAKPWWELRPKRPNNIVSITTAA